MGIFGMDADAFTALCYVMTCLLGALNLYTHIRLTLYTFHTNHLTNRVDQPATSTNVDLDANADTGGNTRILQGIYRTMGDCSDSMIVSLKSVEPLVKELAAADRDSVTRSEEQRLEMMYVLVSLQRTVAEWRRRLENEGRDGSQEQAAQQQTEEEFPAVRSETDSEFELERN